MARKEKYNKADNGEGWYFKSKVFVSDCFYRLSVFIHQKLGRFRKEKPTVDTMTVEQLRAQKRRQKAIELACIWAILIIPLINLAIFWVYGTIQSVPIAFEYYPQSGGKEYSWFNFEYLFFNMSTPGNIFKEALLNSIYYWAFSWAFMTPLSFLIGFFLYKKIVGYKFFRYVFYFPSLLSSVITSSLFLYMLQPDGLVSVLADKWFGIKHLMLLCSSDTAFPTMLFYNFYNGLTGGLLYWLASFARIPQEVVEAGQLDGLSTMGEFRHIAMPIASGFFLTMQVIGITGILGGGGAALLLTNGAYGTYDLGFYEYQLTISGSKQSQGIAGAIGLMKGVVTLPLALCMNRLVMKIEPVEV